MKIHFLQTFQQIFQMKNIYLTFFEIKNRIFFNRVVIRNKEKKRTKFYRRDFLNFPIRQQQKRKYKKKEFSCTFDTYTVVYKYITKYKKFPTI